MAGYFDDRYPRERYDPPLEPSEVRRGWWAALLGLLAAAVFCVTLYLLFAGSTVKLRSERPIECVSVMAKPYSEGFLDENSRAVCAQQRTQRLAWAGIFALVTIGLGKATVRLGRSDE